MNHFAVVIPYFGKFKPSVVLFLESCNRNPDVDFLFFTDCAVPGGVEISSHIHWYSTTLEDIRLLAEQKLQMHIVLEKPYKLCDLRAFYGIVFEDYLKGYEYWGYGDTDVILGRVVSFLETIHYKQYDKINRLGHLSFVRNCETCNRVAFRDMPKMRSATEVLQAQGNTAFDERDFNIKCQKAGLKVYDAKWSADMDMFYWRMWCADKKTFHLLLDMSEVSWAPKNYAKQMFAVIKGITYRVYLKKRKVHLEEFAYIHFRKEVPIRFSDTTEDTFVITREGFEKVEGESAVFGDYDKVLEMIRKYNDQETPLQEMWCFLVQWYRKVSGKRGW